MSELGRWKTALVTGAASGIGRAFAEALAGHGIAVGLLDIAADGLEHTATAIRTRGGRVSTHQADVGVTDAVEGAVRDVAAALGGLDLVVHCAAILGPGAFATQPAATFERVIRVDLLGTANVVRATVPHLRERRGAIACVVSTAAVHGWPALAAYSAAKFGVAGFCDAVRPELAREGVTLTSVFPLLIDTPLLAGADIPPILRNGRRLPPQRVVDKTLAAVARGKARVFVPGSVRVLAALHGLAPTVLDWYGRRVGFAR
jgi:3-oxoacyl-[acyl-carrier protein] reductase